MKARISLIASTLVLALILSAAIGALTLPSGSFDTALITAAISLPILLAFRFLVRRASTGGRKGLISLLVGYALVGGCGAALLLGFPDGRTHHLAGVVLLGLPLRAVTRRVRTGIKGPDPENVGPPAASIS
jgi:hypothetical protein